MSKEFKLILNEEEIKTVEADSLEGAAKILDLELYTQEEDDGIEYLIVTDVDLIYVSCIADDLEIHPVEETC